MQVWANLSQESPETAAAQVRTWLAIDGMCRQHADLLAKTAEKLTEAWAPTKDSAAAAFQAFVERLVSSMRKTAQVAYRNGLNVDAFYQDLMETRARVAWLVAEFERREAAEKTSASGGLAASKKIMESRGWRRELADEAVARMAGTDTTAETVNRMVHVPWRYQTDPRRDEETPDRQNPNGPGGIRHEVGGSGDVSTPVIGAGTASLLPGGMDAFQPDSPVLAGGSDVKPGGGANGVGDSSPQGGTLPLGGAVSRPLPWDGSSSGLPTGRVIGGSPLVPSIPKEDAVSARHAGATRPGAGGGPGAHGSAGVVGAPIMPMSGGMPLTTRDGTRIARPGGVIGGQPGKRHYDPDDPWLVAVKGVAPVIGDDPQRPGGETGEGLPPGVVKVEGWPR